MMVRQNDFVDTSGSSAPSPSGRVFDPWIGPLYDREGLLEHGGLRLLLVGESHYGTPGTERSGFTEEVVRRLALNGGHRFFTTVTRAVTGDRRAGAAQRRDLFERIAFVNCVQAFAAESSSDRTRPTPEMWEVGIRALSATVAEVLPDAVLALSLSIGKRLPDLGVTAHAVRHPSQFFKYADWVPGIQTFLRDAEQTRSHEQ